jgi:hypothetical protein
MKVKPKDVMITVPAVHLLANEDDDAQLAANFNTFIHGKVHLKYEFLGYLGGQRVSIFYLQRNDEFAQLREEFMRLIEEEQIANHIQSAAPVSCGCPCHSVHLEAGCMDCNCEPRRELDA